MKNTILRILISAILFSLLAGIVVAIICLMIGWKTSTQFSNGFFWAGVILISIGLISMQGYSQRPVSGPPDYLDPAERSKLWAADTFRGKKLMAFLGISFTLRRGDAAQRSQLAIRDHLASDAVERDGKSEPPADRI